MPITDGYIERPDYDDNCLFETIGYVTKMYVEQEGQRDQLVFNLEIYYEIDGIVNKACCVYLDVGTTVALAQFQLLRDALASEGKLVVHIHFNFVDHFGDDGALYVYYLQVLLADRLGGKAGTFGRSAAGFEPVRVEQVFDRSVYTYVSYGAGWFVHKGAVSL